MGIKQKINHFLIRYFGVEVVYSKREATAFAEEHFHGKEIVAAEIGVFSGYNAREINKNLNIKRFYLIDPYKDYDDPASDISYNVLKKAKKKAHKINRGWNIFWVERTSEDALENIPENLDFVYIDGNHEYEYVKKDLELYWERLNNNGIIGGHDMDVLSVSKAVFEFAKKNNLEFHFGSKRDWWIIKGKKE